MTQGKRVLIRGFRQKYIKTSIQVTFTADSLEYNKADII